MYHLTQSEIEKLQESVSAPTTFREESLYVEVGSDLPGFVYQFLEWIAESTDTEVAEHAEDFEMEYVGPGADGSCEYKLNVTLQEEDEDASEEPELDEFGEPLDEDEFGDDDDDF